MKKRAVRSPASNRTHSGSTTVLLLTQYFPPETGAAQVRLGAIVKRLKHRNYDVKVVTGMPNYPTGKIFPPYRWSIFRKETWEGVPVYRVWLVASGGKGFCRVLNQISFSITCVPGIFRAGRFNLIFVESPPFLLPVAALLLGRLRGTPVVVNVADLWLDVIFELGHVRGRTFRRLLEAVERRIYQRCAAVTAVTTGVRGRLIAKGVEEDKILFLPNGVDLDDFSSQAPDEALASALGLQGKQLILYAGTHGYIHGLDVVLEAARVVARPDVQFVFVGDGSEKTRLLRLATEMGLTNVTFLAPVPPATVARLLSLSLAGLVTVRNGQAAEYIRSAKAFTTMAAGRPVIYSGSGEGARLVQQAKAGLVIPGEDSSALAQAVHDLCDDPTLVQRLGTNGKAYVERYADWDDLLDNWLTQLHDHLNALGPQEPRPVRGLRRHGGRPQPGPFSTPSRHDE